MYRRQEQHAALAVTSVDTRMLDLLRTALAQWRRRQLLAEDAPDGRLIPFEKSVRLGRPVILDDHLLAAHAHGSAQPARGPARPVRRSHDPEGTSA
jgi:hypothetical protein